MYIIGVIVVMCAAFGFTVSEARTEIICLRAKGMPESTATFSIEAAGQVYNQTNEFVYLGGKVGGLLPLTARAQLARGRTCHLSRGSRLVTCYDGWFGSTSERGGFRMVKHGPRVPAVMTLGAELLMLHVGLLVRVVDGVAGVNLYLLFCIHGRIFRRSA